MAARPFVHCLFVGWVNSIDGARGLVTRAEDGTAGGREAEMAAEAMVDEAAQAANRAEAAEAEAVSVCHRARGPF